MPSRKREKRTALMLHQYILILCAALASTCSASIEFGNKSSELSLRNCLVFDVAGEPVTITGELTYDHRVDVTGNVLRCAPATITKRTTVTGFGREQIARLRGGYDITPEGSTIILDGGTYLDAEEGFIVEELAVSGTLNKIVGSPSFATDIYICGESELTLAMIGTLDADIILDGGTLILDRILELEKYVRIGGAGTICLNGNRLFLAPLSLEPLKGDLHWDDAQTLSLAGATPVDATWTFTGTSLIDGNGERLILSTDARIVIPAESRLTLKDVFVEGATNSTFVFTDNTSVLELDGASIEFIEDIQLLVGTLAVTGNSTLVLNDHNYTVAEAGRCIVDGCRLSLDVYTQPEQPAGGEFRAPEPVYVIHNYIARNVTIDTSEEGNLTLVNNGAVMELTDHANVTNQYFFQHTMLTPEQTIHISSSMSIDADGARVVFSNANGPQLILDPGVQLTVSNLELARINANTIQFGEGATLSIADNVIFSLADDVTWSKEQIIVREGATFRLQSEGPRRSWIFYSEPMGLTPDRYSYRQHLIIEDTARVELYNVLVRGVRHITTAETATFALLGQNVVELYEPVINHNFEVDSTDNHFIMLRSSITMNGKITFADSGISRLDIDVSVNEDSFLYEEDIETPTIQFGAGAVDLSSQMGQATLNFTDFAIDVVNLAQDSFKAGIHGVLSGSTITVLGNPFLQTNERFLLAAGLEMGPGLSGAIVQDPSMIRSRTVVKPRKGERVYGYAKAYPLSPLSGSVVLSEPTTRTYTNFSLADAPANVTLKGGVTVEQGSDMLVVKAGDVINAVGRENVLVVSGDVYIDGLIALDEGASLTLKLQATTGSSAVPTVTFAGESIASFASGSTLKVSGAGQVVISGDTLLDFTAGGSSLIFDDNVQVLTQAGTLSLRGVGALTLQSGAQLTIGEGSDVLIGAQSSDAIDMTITNRGMLILGAMATRAALVDGSLLVFGAGSHSLTVSQSSFIVLNNHANLVTRNMRSIGIITGSTVSLANGSTWTCMPYDSGQLTQWKTYGGSMSGAGVLVDSVTRMSGIPFRLPLSGLSSTTVAVGESITTHPEWTKTCVAQAADGLTHLWIAGRESVLSISEVIVEEYKDGSVLTYNTVTGSHYLYCSTGERVAA